MLIFCSSAMHLALLEPFIAIGWFVAVDAPLHFLGDLFGQGEGFGLIVVIGEFFSVPVGGLRVRSIKPSGIETSGF
jgi:hypothetical protein